jgi:hypothetical protein
VKQGVPIDFGTLECGGSTPLSFFLWKSKKPKKESGVEPPHSKKTLPQS